MIWHDFADELAAKRYGLANNRLTERSTWNVPAVSEQLAELADLAGTGFTQADLAQFSDAAQKASAALATDTSSGFDGLGQQPLLKVVIAPADLAPVEQALAATGEKNRGAALLAVCRAYLEGIGAEGQFDPAPQS